MRDFRKFDIWNNSMNMVKTIYNLCKSLPGIENFGLISQMQRAAVSIPSNIAEGCSRESDLEFKRFLEIALGSAFELETQLILTAQLVFTKELTIGKILEELNTLQRQVNSLITKLKFSSAKGQPLTARSHK